MLMRVMLNQFCYEQVPSAAGPARTSLAIEAPHSHHVLADRYDVSKHGAGGHRIEWDAPETEAGVDIKVGSLEGEGDYHLSAKIVGTTAHLAAAAVLNREDVLLAIFCQWFDDCTFEYDGLQQRGDGATFLLRFPAAAGLTDKFAAALPAAGAQSGTHRRLAIFPDGSVGTASSSSGQPGQGDEVCAGLGRIVALYHRASSFYQARKIMGASISETTMRPNPRSAASAPPVPRAARATTSRRSGSAASSRPATAGRPGARATAARTSRKSASPATVATGISPGRRSTPAATSSGRVRSQPITSCNSPPIATFHVSKHAPSFCPADTNMV
jgi:hypothetical protein